MISTISRILALTLALTFGAAAETLPLPDSLVDLSSPRGEELLLETRGLEA